MLNQNHSKLILPILLITGLVIYRIIPHPYNFAPFGAIALFAAAHIEQKKLGLFIVILTAWISGVVVNNVIYSDIYTSFTLFDENILWQALAYALTFLLGLELFKKISALRVLSGAIASSLIFFIVTNFGTWAVGKFYPMNFGGLISSYIAAIPFFQSTLVGDLIFSSLLFGSYYLINQYKSSTAISR